MRPNRLLMWTASVLVLLPVLPAQAIDAPPRPPISALGKIRDLTVTVRARRALQEDRILGTLNLGVAVENGVASVWGVVPSSETAKKAVARLETVKGVLEVRPDFRFQQPDDGKGLLAGLVPGEGSLARFNVFKAEVRDHAPAGESRRPVKLPGTGPRDTPLLMAPRAVASTRRHTEGEVVHRPKASLADQVERVRQTNPRYRNIQVRLPGTTIEVRRGEGGEEVVEFANQLRRIRGVTDVILTDD